MRKYLLHILIISFVFLLVPTAQVSSNEDEKRIEDAKELVRKYPVVAAAHCELGLAYFKSGRYEEEIESLKQAIRIDPDCGVVYNLGGGRENSTSVLECIYILEKSFNYKVNYSLSEKNRIGDHICYISDLNKFKSRYMNWNISVSLREIIKELFDSQKQRPLQ